MSRVPEPHIDHNDGRTAVVAGQLVWQLHYIARELERMNDTLESMEP